MREILFKGKTIEEGKWIEGSLIIDEKGYYYIGKYIESKGNCSYYCTNRRNGKTLNRFIGIGFSMVDKDTVCEFTGLHDKNGKRIWENDIIFDTYYKKLGVVKFGMGTFDSGIYRYYGWHYESEGSVDHHELYKYDELVDFEVLGNIFDNPELLTAERSE